MIILISLYNRRVVGSVETKICVVPCELSSAMLIPQEGGTLHPSVLMILVNCLEIPGKSDQFILKLRQQTAKPSPVQLSLNSNESFISECK